MARPTDQALVSDQARAGLAPTGFDPSRERVRVILDCEWGQLEQCLALIIENRPMFDGREPRPGWGWWLSKRSGPSAFVRQTKSGFSATTDRPTTPVTAEEGKTG